MERSALLPQLKSLDAPVATRVLRWLISEDTRLASERTAIVSVTQSVRLWSTRLRNTEITGRSREGAEALLKALQLLGAEQSLEQIASRGTQTVGSLFFVLPEQRCIGAIMTHTPYRAADVQNRDAALAGH